MNNWYEIENPNEVLSPALLFYPDRIVRNLDRMIKIAGSADRLRPHIKTHKCPNIVRMHLENGITQFKCATLSEAQMLAQTGAKDVLVAMSLYGPSQLLFIRLIKKFPEVRFSVLVDSLDVLKEWGNNVVGGEMEIEVYIDIDPDMHRTGISAEQAAALSEKIMETKGLKLMGLHHYDGHIRDLDLKLRTEITEKIFLPSRQLADQLKPSFPHLEIICGGSLTFPIHARHLDRILSPGTTVFWDANNGIYPDIEFEIAAMLLTRVISKPTENTICLDLGHKAIASEMPHPRAVFPAIGEYQVAHHSEEHLSIQTQNMNLSVGDVVYGIPKHICPTVALHKEAAIVREGKVTEYWPITARDRIYHL